MLLAALLICGCAGSTAAIQEAAETGPVDDFDRLWEFVRQEYAFLDDKAIDWQEVRERYRPRAAKAADRRELLSVLEATLDQLYDPHCMFNTNAGDSWHPVPRDLWVERIDGSVVVTAVRGHSAAAAAGIRVGDSVFRIGSIEVDRIAALRMPHGLTREHREADAWSLLSAVSGRHDEGRTFSMRRWRYCANHTFTLIGTPADPRPAVESRLIDGLGYIRIGTFSASGVIEAFDQALDELVDCPALILDVRENGGGDTAIARPILGRLVRERTQYAWMARRQGDGLGERWAEFVEPRGSTYDGPVVVLVDRFSVSMAEGFAMAIHGMKRGRIVGTRMAGLGAAIGRVELPYLGASAQISTEPVYHVDGTPRWMLRPDVEVDLLKADPDNEDPILDAGLLEVRRLLR